MLLALLCHLRFCIKQFTVLSHSCSSPTSLIVLLFFFYFPNEQAFKFPTLWINTVIHELLHGHAWKMYLVVVCWQRPRKPASSLGKTFLFDHWVIADRNIWGEAVQQWRCRPSYISRTCWIHLEPPSNWSRNNSYFLSSARESEGDNSPKTCNVEL